MRFSCHFVITSGATLAAESRDLLFVSPVPNVPFGCANVGCTGQRVARGDPMKYCKNCLASMMNSDLVCKNCGEEAKPLNDRARLMSAVVDEVLKQIGSFQTTAPDEEMMLVGVEVMSALKHSHLYPEYLRQHADMPFTGAMASAILLGWSLREEVESNRWDTLPRASDKTYTEALRQMSRELNTGE